MMVAMGAVTMGAMCATSGPASAVVSDADWEAAEARREARVMAQLRELSPEASRGYEEAIVAMRKGNLGGAEELFGAVHRAVPGFTGGMRRLCWVRGRLNKRETALPLCRAAARDGTSRSLAMLSLALTGFEDLAFEPTVEAAREAFAVATRAVNQDADDVLAQRAVCFAGRALGDASKMRRCTRALEQLDTMQSAATMWLERGRTLVARVGPYAEPDPIRLDEGAYAAKRAAKIRAGWPEPTFLLADIAVRRNDMSALSRAVRELNETAFDDVRTARYDTIAALAGGDTDRARNSLARALGLGLDERTALGLQQQIDEADPVGVRWLVILAVLIASCASAMWLYRRRRQRDHKQGHRAV